MNRAMDAASLLTMLRHWYPCRPRVAYCIK